MSKHVIGDGFQVTINFKWLLQLLGIVAIGTYTVYTFQMRLDNMDRDIANNMIELQSLIQLHEEESAKKLAAMQESLKWYEQELVKVGNISLNPLSWGKKK